MSDPTLTHWRQSTRGSGALYSALNQDRQEIRHLTVHSGGFNDEIRCKLTPVSLTQKPAYTALSYCWGDANDCVEITIDDQQIAVTKSLETALRYLRSSQEDVVAWVDAICINQRDLDEKSNQVRMMGDIYANGKW
jgi:Heterokaryon incompatibility protein (HET)